MAGLISPIADYESQRIAEQLATAKALRKQSAEMDTGAGYHGGRVYAVGNLFSPLAQAIGGAVMENRANDAGTALNAQRQQQRNQLLSSMPSEYTQAEVQQATPEQEFGPTQAPMEQATVQRPLREYTDAMNKWSLDAVNVPGMEGVAGFGLQQALAAPEKRAAAEESRKQRVFELTQKAQDNRVSQQERLAAQSQLQLTLKQMSGDTARAVAGIAAAARAGNNNPPVNQDAADFIAARFLEGDQNALVGIGRNKDLHAAVMGSIARQAKEQNIDPKEAVQRGLEFGSEKAAQRKIGERGATVEMAAKEANNMIPIVTDLSRKIPRTDFPTINAAGNIIKKQSGDPNVVAFDQSIDTLINGYARAISPTGVPTVADKKRAHEKLNAAFSQGQLDSVVGVMQQEMDAALRSPGQASAARREARVGKPEGASPASNVTVVRTGKDANGRKVEQLSDGTVRYAQ